MIWLGHDVSSVLQSFPRLELNGSLHFSLDVIGRCFSRKTVENIFAARLASFDGNDDEEDWWDEEVPVAAIRTPQLSKIEAELMGEDDIVQA
ncbi:unnamed protein product [Linum tenue]|uniref:Uncharacterized protein n=1 Tax=Linum tenue TaxID=586396 RepID=A0AAV0HCB6_9ROSI|nr:unnamed protein product [Linum tenue]